MADAAVRWSRARIRRLVVVGWVARGLEIAAVVVAGLTVFQVIPPVVDLRPRWGSVPGYVGFWFMTVALVCQHIDWLARRRRARLAELAEANAAEGQIPYA